MVEIAQRVEFLRRIHLFEKVDDNQLILIAQRIQERVCQREEVIVHPGREEDHFFMIYAGNVTIKWPKPRGGDVLEVRTTGDYFGEENVLKRAISGVRVAADEKTTLFVLSPVDLERPFKKSRQLKANFAVAAASQRLARRTQFNWLRENEGETIYFLARRHPFVLVQALLVPTILAMVAFVALVMGLMLRVPLLLWPGVIGLGLVIGWGVWKGVEWQNDYYIVTNQRVVWQERMVGVYDNRREVPLSAIQRISVQMEFWQQQVDCGNLVVRTIVGSTLSLRDVQHPYQAAALIEEHWKRVKELQSEETGPNVEEEAMHQALRERLVGKKSASAPIPPLVEDLAEQKSDLPAERRSLSGLFRLRVDGLSTTTYRKHWIVLLGRIWLPCLILLALLASVVYELIHGVDMLLLVEFLVFLLTLAWGGYQYSDWSNDIYQVTPDQIVDIYKKPLGAVVSDIASLDNILNLESERKGLLQMLFNYGDVRITIGGGKGMVFENVSHPSAVQDDIERRRLERLAQKEHEMIKADRERAADWIAAYHRSREELRQAEQDGEGSDETGVQ